MASSQSEGGSFLRIRTLNFAVEYAGIRVRETTTAADTIALVSSKLRLDAKEEARRKIVMVYRIASERGKRGKAKWRIRTLSGNEALLPLRRSAAAAAAALLSTSQKSSTSPTRRDQASLPNAASLGSSQSRLGDEVRFYLHDELSTPLDCSELADGEDASGSESSDDERPPQAKYVADRQALAAKPSASKIGSLLKRSEKDQNLWRRRHCVLVDDRLWYWRDTVVPPSTLVKASKTHDQESLYTRGGGGGEKKDASYSASSPPSVIHTTSRLDIQASDQTANTRKPKKRIGYSASSAAAIRQQKINPAAGTKSIPQPQIDTRRSYDPYELEYDRLIRSRAACVPLASNIVTEISGKRDIPHGIEISTASRTLVFRASSRAAQLEWLEHIRSAIDLATQNEYLALAQLIISDEQALNTDALITDHMRSYPNFFRPSSWTAPALHGHRTTNPQDTVFEHDAGYQEEEDDDDIFTTLAKIKGTLQQEALARQKCPPPSRVVYDDEDDDKGGPLHSHATYGSDSPITPSIISSTSFTT